MNTVHLVPVRPDIPAAVSLLLVMQLVMQLLLHLHIIPPPPPPASVLLVVQLLLHLHIPPPPPPASVLLEDRVHERGYQLYIAASQEYGESRTRISSCVVEIGVFMAEDHLNVSN